MALVPVICHVDRFSNRSQELKPSSILPASVEKHGKQATCTSTDHPPSPTQHTLIDNTSDDRPYGVSPADQVTGRLSLRSRSSLHLLSQCSSLHSLPSLGLSFHGPHNLVEQKLVDGDYDVIESDHRCIKTVKREADQVMVSSDSIGGQQRFYTGSSTSPQASMKAWTIKLGKDESSTAVPSVRDNSEGSEILRKGTVTAMVVVGNVVISAHQDLRIRSWEMPSVRLTPTANHKLVAVMPTYWDCLRRSLLPGAYVHVRRNQGKSLWINHVDVISALAVTHCKGFLYSASWDRNVKVWRLADSKCMESFRAHEDAINTLAVSGDGFLYTGCADSSMKVWARHAETKSKNTKREQKNRNAYSKHILVGAMAAAHRSAVNALALSSDGSLLYSGACDKAIVVWERENIDLPWSSSPNYDGNIIDRHHCSVAGALRGHRQAVLSLATVANCLCSGSADKTIRVWHRVSAQLHTCVALLEGHTSPVRSLSIATDDEQTCNLCSDSPAPASLHTYMPTKMCFFLYSASLDHDIKLWRLSLAPRVASGD